MSGVLGGLIAAFPTPITSSFESIATASGSGVSTITFSSIPSTYKSLQIRVIVKSSSAGTAGVRINGVSTSTYYSHDMYGNGATAATQASVGNRMQYLIQTTDLAHTGHAVAIIDIIDYASTSKYKTVRSFNGFDRNGAGEIYLSSALYQGTDAVSSITIYDTGSTNWTTGTSFALYGIKG